MVKLKDRRKNRQVIRTARSIQRELLKCACLSSVESYQANPWGGGTLIHPDNAWNVKGWDLPFDNLRIWPLDFNIWPVVSEPTMNNITTVPYGFYRSFTRVFLNLKYTIYGYDPYNAWQYAQDTPLRAKYYVYIITLRKKYAWACSAFCYDSDYTGVANKANYGLYLTENVFGSFAANSMTRNLYTSSTSAPYSCTVTGESSEYAWNQNFKPKWLGKYFVIKKKYCVKLNYRKPDIRMKIIFNFKKHGLSYKNITLTQSCSGATSLSSTTRFQGTIFGNFWTYDMHTEKSPILVMFTSGLTTRQTPYNAGSSWTSAFEQRETLSVRYQMQHFFMVPPNQSLQSFTDSTYTLSAFGDISANEYNGVYFFAYAYRQPTGTIASTVTGGSISDITVPIYIMKPYITDAPSWVTGRGYQSIMSTLSLNVNEEDSLITDDTVTTDASVTYSAARQVASADDGGFDSVDGVDDGESEQTTKSLVERFLKKVKV